MTVRSFFRILLSIAFVFAGTLHFTNTASYLAIMPPYLPYHLSLVYLSGICEVAGGIGVLFPPLRRLSGYGLAALLIAVFPANLHMALNNISLPGMESSPLMLWLRLPLQAVLIVWALWVTSPETRA